MHQGHPVAGLHRIEEGEGPARPARAPHVGHHVDVAPLDQIPVDAAMGLTEEAAAGLAVGRLGEDHRERPGRGGSIEVGREVDVGPQHGAVGHLDGLVQGGTDAVAGRTGGPAAGRGGDGQADGGGHGHHDHHDGAAKQAGPIGRGHRTSPGTLTIVR